MTLPVSFILFGTLLVWAGWTGKSVTNLLIGGTGSHGTNPTDPGAPAGPKGPTGIPGGSG